MAYIVGTSIGIKSDNDLNGFFTKVMTLGGKN